MGWTFVWLMVILKIPIAMLLYLVWWAVRATPEQPETAPDSGGDSKRPRAHPRPPLPRFPRRGPHGEPAAAPPERVRTTHARSRARDDA